MALAIDSSTPAFFVGPNTTNIQNWTTNSFSPPANSVLVIVFINGQNTAIISSMTDSLGSHLTYTKLVSNAAQNTNTEIWSASCPSAQTSMTVTAHTSVGITGNDSGIGVIVFTGANTTQNGATNTSSSASGLPSTSLTTTQNGSLVLGAVANFSNSTLPTVPSGQTVSFNGITQDYNNTTSGTAGWVQGNSATTPSSGTNVTINDTAPTIQYSMTIAEIVAAPSLGGTISWTRF